MKNARRFWCSVAVGLGVVTLGLNGWFFSKNSRGDLPDALSLSSESRKRQTGEGGGVHRHPDGVAQAGAKQRLAGGGEVAGELNRQTFQFDRKETKVDSWVAEVRALRGSSLMRKEREAGIAFLAGGQVPDGMSKGSMQWLSDEVLTALRLQQPPWKGLAAALAEAAFQPTTDPVVRDYIMQHLGHWWEQNGAQPEIEEALWRGVGTADSTTPGTALIALNNGLQREQRGDDLARMRAKALELAENPNASLAVRSTALSIATEGGGAEAKKLATRLAGEETTPVILRKVAEHALGAGN